MSIKKTLIIATFSILSLITLFSLGFAFYINNKEEPVIEQVYAMENTNIEDELDFYVEVKGAVKKPGVYKVDNKTIINDVIKLSGGFNKNAYTNNINLSKRVQNELVIYVFTKNEYKNNNKNKNNNIVSSKESNEVVNSSNKESNEIIVSSNKECTSNGYLIDNCTSNNISIIDSSEEVVPVITNNEEDNSLININTASLSELTTLPGIGESKAQAIINYRNNTLFTSVNDLLNVAGISEKTYEKIQNLITV